METILIIGRKEDPHVQGIKKELEKLNENFYILDEFSTSNSFAVEFRKGYVKSQAKFDGLQIKNKDVKSIWNTSALKIVFNENIVEEAKNFARVEWTEGITTLWNSIETKWINHPLAIINAVNRVKQLKLAEEMNLDTPETLVTNDPEVLTNFYDKFRGKIIAKTLRSSEGLPENKMIFTTKITKEALKKADSLRYAPCVFQEYIPKKTELRSTIIDHKVHTAEIFSQMSEKTKHDWRNYDDFEKTPYKQTELPEEINEKLIKLMDSMNLKFGAVDLIRTPDDKIVFLEINPNGRWWWIQELTGMNIAQDIALNLAEG